MKRKTKKPKIKGENILEIVDQIGKEVNQILKERRTEKYFYALVLLYSFIENLLKHLCLIDTFWKQAQEGIIGDEVTKELVEYYFDRLNFRNIIDKAFNKQLVDSEIKNKAHKLRKHRNKFIHQCWLYKRDPRYLKKELELAIAVVNPLIEKLNSLHEETGVLDLYAPSVFCKSRQRDC